METHLILFVFTVSVIYYLFTARRNVQRYTDQGVVYLGNFYGNLLRAFLNGEHLTDSVLRRYNQVKVANQKFGFELEFGRPAFFITDPDLVKHVLIKDFDHFANPFKFATSNNNEDLFGRMVVSLRGSEWKALRSKLGSAFSNAKLKRVFPFMDSSGKKLIKYLNVETQKAVGGLVNIEVGISKFTMDFISSSSFGLDSHVFEDKEKLTLLDRMILKLKFGNARLFLQVAMVSIFPALSDFLGYSLIDIQTQTYFKDMMMETIRDREQNQEHKRNDFIDFLLEARDEQQQRASQGEEFKRFKMNMEVSLDPIDIVAHCVTFFIAGYDTVRAALQLLAYNLAINREVQERLFQELKNALTENEEFLNYDHITKLEYLDNVISESMRILSVGPQTFRLCTKDFLIPDTSVIIPKGSSVVIPIAGIHSDPDYFPNPQEFIPERFSAENKSKILPCSYIPFGQGPRMCLGMRPAVLEIKTAIAHLVLNYSLEPCNRTPIPMKFSPTSVFSTPAGGLWLKLRQRT